MLEFPHLAGSLVLMPHFRNLGPRRVPCNDLYEIRFYFSYLLNLSSRHAGSDVQFRADCYLGVKIDLTFRDQQKGDF